MKEVLLPGYNFFNLRLNVCFIRNRSLWEEHLQRDVITSKPKVSIYNVTSLCWDSHCLFNCWAFFLPCTGHSSPLWLCIQPFLFINIFYFFFLGLFDTVWISLSKHGLHTFLLNDLVSNHPLVLPQFQQHFSSSSVLQSESILKLFFL